MTLDEQNIINNISISDLLQNISARTFILYEENRRLKKQLIWHDLRKNPTDVPKEFEEEAVEYIKTHDDYRVFALDDADIMQIFKDGAELGFREGIKAQSEETACCDGEQDKPNVFQQFCKKELPEDIQRRVERAAEYGESNAEYFFRAGFFLAHELEEAKKKQAMMEVEKM